MTRDEIMAMKPGREMDELVAEHVMGWTKDKKPNGYWYSPGQPTLGKAVPRCSTEIAPAWEIASKFDYFYLYRWDNQPCDFIVKAGEWECKLSERQDENVLGIGKTAPEAIVKAALLAVMEVEK